MDMKIKAISAGARAPEYGSSGAGCFDLFCSEDTMLPQGVPVLVPTGLAFEVPTGYVMTILPRSSTSCKGIAVFTGQVDADYRGPVHAVAMNLANVRPVIVHKGDRIAQARLEKVERTTFEQVENLSPTDRGCGGFGSTGQ